MIKHVTGLPFDFILVLMVNSECLAKKITRLSTPGCILVFQHRELKQNKHEIYTMLTLEIKIAFPELPGENKPIYSCTIPFIDIEFPIYDLYALI